MSALSDWVLAIEGTDAGRTAALLLALLSAFAHAAFGALQKGRHDPWLTRGAIDICYGSIALLVALFVVPWPEARLVPVLVGVVVIHAVYKWLMAMAYSRGAYTVVYPVVRGTGPLVTVLFAMAVFDERFAPLQWLGILVLSGAIITLGLVNLAGASVERRVLRDALGLAVLTGVMVAVYTVYDAWGIRLAADPVSFLVWFFVVDGLFVFPWIALARWRGMADPPAPGPLMARGLVGALTGFVSFGAVMLATRLDKVGEAAALRETSAVFAALIGWAILREPVGPLRAGLMALIAAGAVLVEFGALR
ncbi:MAG: DMT family transporter [Pseudomonadota bacterium]